MKQPLDYYAGPDIKDDDFVISNLIDLRAVQSQSSPIDRPLVTIVIIALGLIVGTAWWVLG